MSFNCCWLNPFVSEVLFSGKYWSCEECRMASGQEPSSRYICSENASSFSGGSGTGKLSSRGINASPFCGGSGTGKLSSRGINASPFCGGSGTGKLSSWGLFSFVWTNFLLILSGISYDNDTTELAVISIILWLRHSTGIAKGVFRYFVQPRSPFEQELPSAVLIWRREYGR